MTTETNKGLNMLKESIKDLMPKLAKYSAKKLKKQQIYLNNDVVSDFEFITMVQSLGLSEYYTNFPSDTMDRMLLVEYVLMTEVIFLYNGVKFKSFLK